MNNVPQFSLRWNSYVNHVTKAFNLLRFENHLVDVTLCCDGGKIKAHRMLLSACSNYFKEIFKENPCPHPVIIFKNVKYEDLVAIVNFIYHGEVNILQEQLESFLVTAELLEVKGLTDNMEEDISTHQIKSQLDKTNDSNLGVSRVVEETSLFLEEPINLATIQNTNENFGTDETIQYSNPHEKGDEENSCSILNLTESLNSKNNVHNEEMQVDAQNLPVEDIGDKNNSESEMAKFRCQLCPKGFKHPTSLTLHKDSHEGKTQCPVCHRSFSRSYDMRSHLQKIHQGKQLTIKEIRYKSSGEIGTTKPFSQNI